MAKGVRNETLAPIATLGIIGSGDTFIGTAVATPIGIITSAVDVLEMNWPTWSDRGALLDLGNAR
ncbi:MAG TPA: hypothetical protein VGD42_00180 [Lysobacter sp.]